MKLLTDLLSSLLAIPIESIKNVVIKNSEILPDSVTGKFVRMDLNMEVDGKLINIEMQYGKDYQFKDRALFHWSKLYGGGLQGGEDYKDLKHSICINIVDFKMFDCEEYHSHFTLMEKNRHEELTDKCAIHFFELTKIGKKPNKDNKMELWLQLINAESEEEFEMLKQTGVAPIQEAVYVLYQMSEDEKIQEMARMREKAWLVEMLNTRGAREEGKAEGRAEGKAEGIKIGMAKTKAEVKDEVEDELKAEVVRNAINMGMTPDAIVQLTGLTREKIEELKNAP
jgi:predicted transposase/invertase (TIGR01784 family)